MSGSLTISTSGTPERLKSTRLASAAWIFLPASSSMWMRTRRMRRGSPPIPLCKGGYISLPAGIGGEPRRIRLVRNHMEDDAGKNIHAADASLVDFNRSGVPLVEIVSEPDLRSADEAGAYLRELHTILR